LKNGARRVLVTGGAGYIGSLLCGEFLRRGFRVTVVDSLLFGGNSLLAYLGHPAFAFHKADVCDREAVRPWFENVDHVVHLAAIVGYPACIKAGGEASYACNVDGTRNVFELAEGAGAERFVFASTYSNYGVSDDGRPVTEDSPLHPQSIYAETKVAAERELLERAERSRCAPVILRFATLFGPSPRTRFDLIINQFVLEAVRTGRLVVYEKEYNRSFVHIRDIVRAILLALEAPLEKIRGEIFNVGSNGGNHAKEEIARLVLKHVPGTVLEYRDLSFDGDMRDVRVAFDKIERALGFRAEAGVEDGIREMSELLRSGLLTETGIVHKNAGAND
jgi:nucleoside-diphosphate-sugar epimerase